MMDAAWRSDIGSESLHPTFRVPHIMSHLEPATTADISDDLRALDQLRHPNGISNVSGRLASPPTNPIPAAPQILLDKFENPIRKSKQAMVGLPEKREKRRRFDQIPVTEAKGEGAFSVKRRPAMGVGEEEEHRVSDCSKCKPKPPSPTKPKKKKKKLKNKSNYSKGIRDLLEDSLDYFFVISTLQFPAPYTHSNYSEGLPKYFHTYFKPASGEPAFRKMIPSSMSDLTHASHSRIFFILFTEVCHRSMAFLWILTPIESIELRVSEHEKMRNWLMEEVRIALGMKTREGHDNSPIQHLLSNLPAEINAERQKVVSQPIAERNPSQPHSRLGRMRNIVALRTKFALQVLANYYESENSEKWSVLFRDERDFVRLFAHLKQAESSSQMKKYNIQKKGLEKLDLLPWKDEKSYPVATTSKILKSGTIHASRILDVDKLTKKLSVQL